MERAIIGAALVFAALVAAFSIFGLGMPRFSGWGGQDPVVVSAPGKLAPKDYQASEIKIEHAAARVVVTPEDRQDVSIAIDNPGALPMPEITRKSGELVVDGKLRGRTKCRDGGGASVNGYGEIGAGKLPLITIRTPRSVDLKFNAAGSAEIGAAQALELSLAGCGRATIGDVAETLDLDMAGAGDVQAGSAGKLDLRGAGANHATIGAVSGGAEIELAGASEAKVARIDGALDYRAAGAGVLKVETGALQTLNISSGGAGVFELGGGTVDSATITDGGAGRVKIAAPVRTLVVKLAGAGSVEVSDNVGDIDADIAGAGRVSVKTLTGKLKKKTLGPGEVVVGP